MKIYYQGNTGSYMHIASEHIQHGLSLEIDTMEGKTNFKDVWDSIGTQDIAVLAIENSYMGSIHPNIYGFLKYDCKIIGIYDMEINHCLCSKETDISKVAKAYSQSPALDQCYNYLKAKEIEPRVYSDTSLAAQYVSENEDSGKAAICSESAAKLYGLNILDKNIQDQDQNTTRFAIVAPNSLDVTYSKIHNRVTILFSTSHDSGGLYGCLGALANRSINMTKIESIPLQKGHFSYSFWITFEGSMQDESVQSALKEIQTYTHAFRIIGEY